MKRFFSEFKQFIARGNVMDMAGGAAIGGAFSVKEQRHGWEKAGLHPRLSGKAHTGLDWAGLYGDPGGAHHLVLFHRKAPGQPGTSSRDPRPDWLRRGRPGELAKHGPSRQGRGDFDGGTELAAGPGDASHRNSRTDEQLWRLTWNRSLPMAWRSWASPAPPRPPSSWPATGSCYWRKTRSWTWPPSGTRRGWRGCTCWTARPFCGGWISVKKLWLMSAPGRAFRAWC